MFDILTFCAAVVGSLCIQDTVKAEIQYGAGWSGAIITDKNGVVISSMMGSDALVMPYTAQMHKVCTKNECLFYKSGCAVSAEATKCTIWYSFRPSMPLRQIEITGEARNVRTAIGHLKLIRSDRMIVPLSRFHYDATDALPPTCYSRTACKAK